MRPPEDMRAAQAGQGPSNRRRILLALVVIALFLLLMSLRGLAGFYTEYLWFDALGFTSVWRTVIFSRVMLAVLFTAVFFVLMLVNLWVADRLGPAVRPRGPEEELVERYHALVGSRTRLVKVGVSLIFALIAGVGVSSQWQEWLLFINSEDFGVEDALFGRDVGFYVFQLPFLSYLVGWFFAAFFIIFVVTAVAHYLNGGIRLQTTGRRVSAAVKGHLSLLLGMLALVRAAGYWLDQFELTLSTRGFVDGASYTDVNAQLPAIRLLIIISLFSFGLLIFNIWRRGFTYPIIAVGLWALVATIAGTAYPAIVQRFQVVPDESNKEEEYIVRNIEATRQAFGLDQVVERPFEYEESLTAEQVVDNLDTVTNVRLLDPVVVEDTFNQLQGIRGFYDFRDVDVDRYVIDGKVTQVVLSARELLLSGLPNKSWESEHVAFTHGYSLAVAPANDVAAGRPGFVVGDIPTRSPADAPTLQVDQPGIYYGEDLGGYAIVGAERDEVDYQTAEDTTRQTRYEGTGGIDIGGFFRRAAYALKFADTNLLISGQITGDSRIIYIRDIEDRVKELAPFLSYDADPYPVLVDGRLFWVIDAYTTTNRFPYSQRAETREVSTNSGLNRSFNYVRNSVKAVVDAYNGSVEFYVIDEDDPLVRSYRGMFPDLFSEEPPSEALQAQFRYPEDMFRVQTNMWGRYRIGDGGEFYDAVGRWSVAQDPGTEIGVNPQETQEFDAETGITTTSERRIDPQYLLMRLPGDTAESFLNFRPFVPFSEEDTRKDLAGFMVAHSDPGEYGMLEVFEMPSNRQVDGPALFNSKINTDREISETFTLLEGSGSKVRPGNLLVVPVDNSLLYVRPVFVEATGGTAAPELEQVIVGLGDELAMRPTYEEALAAVVPGLTPAMVGAGDIDIVDPGTDQGTDGDPDTDDGSVDDGSPPETTVPSQSLDDLLEAASAAFAEADVALREGDLAAYQEAVRRAEELLNRAREELDSDTPDTTTTTEGASA